METEVVLLRRFTRTGDAEAFAEIIRRHAGLVYGAALRILADVDRASDVAQETFLQLTKDAGIVTGSLPGWLHRVATHKAIDAVRKDAARRRRESQYAASRPREVTEWKDLSASVDEGLNALDTEMREILVAHFLEGQTTRQIASTVGVSQATISRRIDTGVTVLRRTLQRRGLLVAAGALGTLLTEHAVEAAPGALLSELGKMALAGNCAAAASTGGSWILHTTGGAVLAGVKAKAVAAVAVAAIGVGSVVTYHEITRSSFSGAVVETQPVSRSSRPAQGPMKGSVASRVSTDESSETSQWWSQMIAEARDEVAQTNVPVKPQTKASPTAGSDAAEGFALASDPPAEPQEDSEPSVGMLMGGGMMGGMGMGAYRHIDPNDPNGGDPDGR